MKKLGVHGESLGGMIAAYLASTKSVDFLCVDRTFSSLYKVARYNYGFVLGTLFYIFVSWTQNYSKNYVSANTYKVITVEPNDEIIPLRSSLCADVMSEYISYKYENDKKYGKEIRITDNAGISGAIYK